MRHNPNPLIKNKKCQVCGKPATCFVQDVTQILDWDQLVVNYTIRGESEDLCQEHGRTAKIYNGHGDVVDDF